MFQGRERIFQQEGAGVKGDHLLAGRRSGTVSQSACFWEYQRDKLRAFRAFLQFFLFFFNLHTLLGLKERGRCRSQREGENMVCFLPISPVVLPASFLEGKIGPLSRWHGR